ncbi:Succinate-semialdehyde dehydrogenase, mitochondrial [Trichinella sp. T6]|nr:Succinate-semialdehyde dehydrogenase, mitochondrial [Trichinella sp. T6]
MNRLIANIGLVRYHLMFYLYSLSIYEITSLLLFQLPYALDCFCSEKLFRELMKLLKLKICSYVCKRFLSNRFFREQAFINGEWVNSSTQSTFAVYNPVDNISIANVQNCTVHDAQLAVNAAADALKTWGFTSVPKDRAAILQKWSSILLENVNVLASLLTTEQGKPLAEARAEIQYSASFFEWFGQEARRIYGDIVPANQLGRQLFHFREPAGVSAMITPWNFPAAMIARKVGAAMAAGCTCVIKPAEDTPLSALALAVTAEAAGVPKGVFNVVPCDRRNASKVGQLFCESKDVSVISFTGSTAVGKLLLQQSANTVKRVCLELGGNAPFIVFPSANLDAAVKGAMASKFRCSGQTCVCANRFFIHESVHDDFVQKLKLAIDHLVVGDGKLERVTQGPLVNEKAVEKVQYLVDDAVSKGACLVCGGSKHPKGDNFFQPTLLTNVNNKMDIAKNEIFGPVVPVIKFNSEEDVINMANSVDVGLAGYFYSENLQQIFRVARRLQVGMIGINEGVISTCEAAFGGIKESGLGREASYFGMDEYTQIKTVCLGGI